MLRGREAFEAVYDMDLYMNSWQYVERCIGFEMNHHVLKDLA